MTIHPRLEKWGFRVSAALVLVIAVLAFVQLLGQPGPPIWLYVLMSLVSLATNPFVYYLFIIPQRATSGIPPWGVGARRLEILGPGDAYTFLPSSAGATGDSISQTAAMTRAIWYEPEPHQHVAVQLDFDLHPAADAEVVDRALAKALHEATLALPGRGKLHARAHFAGGEGSHERVHVLLDVRGHGADESWAKRAAEVYAITFERVVHHRGVEAVRVE